jgi:hypothetical protein
MDTKNKRLTPEMRRLQKSLLEYAKTRPQRINKDGYVLISIEKKYWRLQRKKGQPFYYGWQIVSVPVLFHHWFMEQMLGRKLRKNEDVHHKNEIRSDNRFRNLEVLTDAEHLRHHHAVRTERAAVAMMKLIRKYPIPEVG